MTGFPLLTNGGWFNNVKIVGGGIENEINV